MDDVAALRLVGAKDYLLFRGTVAKVVARGRFNNLWQVPAADAEKMRATGVVTFSDTPSSEQSR